VPLAGRAPLTSKMMVPAAIGWPLY
jgi:hypothetical protein